MVDLLEYGFVETRKSDNWKEYEGHDYRITIFDYMYKTFNGTEVNHKSFVINTKATTSRAFPLEELEQWLKDKGINKISQA